MTIQRLTSTEGYPTWVNQSAPNYFEISMQRNDVVLHEIYNENPPTEAGINVLIQEMSNRLKEMPEEETRPYVPKELPVVSRHIDIIESSSARPEE